MTVNFNVFYIVIIKSLLSVSQEITNLLLNLLWLLRNFATLLRLQYQGYRDIFPFPSVSPSHQDPRIQNLKQE